MCVHRQIVKYSYDTQKQTKLREKEEMLEFKGKREL